MTVSVVEFKHTLARFASGVTVVTTLGEQGPVGATVSAFSSVSIDPPQVLVCLDKRLYTRQRVKDTGVFAVSILAANQQRLGLQFAGMIPELEDRFAGVATHTAVTGVPILAGCVAWLDCRVAAVYDSGSSDIIVGAVQAAWGGDDLPILYFNRGWYGLLPEGKLG